MEVNRRSIPISPDIHLLERDFGNKSFTPVYSDDNCVTGHQSSTVFSGNLPYTLSSCNLSPQSFFLML